ncbi:DUF4166 domain-containing protein [Thiofilum flexile]|uniref:DUF4166 domain-containing protein n=1 Tax=Thiofilum flexile TaxID=125627 RepID=UPI00037AA08E|nr:DUF4166 domain-containing protein [Thiofilum flexile]
MTQLSMIQQALGSSWEALPPALKAHHQSQTNQDIGFLDISYPLWMQPYLSVMRWFGVMVNRRAKQVPTQVQKCFVDQQLQWARTLTFSDGKIIAFNSYWVYEGGNVITEYINRFMGLRLSVEMKDQALHYHGQGMVLRLGRHSWTLPESLFLGHTTIIERAIDDQYFAMDFRLTHPWLGEVFRYAGTFKTVS